MELTRQAQCFGATVCDDASATHLVWPAPTLNRYVVADLQMQLHMAMVVMSHSAVHDPVFVATSNAFSQCGDNVCSVLDKQIAVMMLYKRHALLH